MQEEHNEGIEEPLEEEEVLPLEEQLNILIQPYKKEIRRKTKILQQLELCVRFARRNDFFQLAETLSNKQLQSLEEESEFAVEDEKEVSVGDLIDKLVEQTDQKITLYQKEFITDIKQLAEEADLFLEVDFPRLYSRKGISAVVDFAKRTTAVNGKKIKSVNPAKIISEMKKFDKRLYGRKFDAQTWVDNLFLCYSTMLKERKEKKESQLPIRDFYLQLVISQQTSSFFGDMDKRRFRGYALDEFSVDIWRYIQSPVTKTSCGHVLRLSGGRNKSLWLIDFEGELRQISSISFKRNK